MASPRPRPTITVSSKSKFKARGELSHTAPEKTTKICRNMKGRGIMRQKNPEKIENNGTNSPNLSRVDQIFEIDEIPLREYEEIITAK